MRTHSAPSRVLPKPRRWAGRPYWTPEQITDATRAAIKSWNEREVKRATRAAKLLRRKLRNNTPCKPQGQLPLQFSLPLKLK
jgi:hypothetical protein